jgi:hypothetical protein
MEYSDYLKKKYKSSQIVIVMGTPTAKNRFLFIIFIGFVQLVKEKKEVKKKEVKKEVKKKVN